MAREIETLTGLAEPPSGTTGPTEPADRADEAERSGAGGLDLGSRCAPDAETLALFRGLFEGHPGPAVLFDRAATPYGLNAPGDRLAEALAGDGGVAMMPQLVQLAVKARIAGKGLAREVPMPDGRSRIEATVLPQADGALLMLGRDATLEASIRTALAESRTRFKDLVDLAADFAWETDAAGRFSFVSAGGALGWPPERLIGQAARDLLVDPGSAPRTPPFEAAEPTRNVELWVADAEGGQRCLLVSAAPLHDGDGARSGARGIAIDITEERLQQAELARLKTREKLVHYILNALRGEVDPTDRLRAAALAMGRAVSADACLLEIVNGGETVLAQRFGEPPPPGAFEEAADRLRATAGIADGAAGGADRAEAGPAGRWLGVAARRNGEVVGVVTLWRRGADGWDEEERRLLEAVEQHFSIAFRQIGDQLQLERLSRTDDLTGLSNRRAFLEELTLSVQRCRRRNDVGALLYLDLDNFKPINDRFGHEAGDRVLRALGQRLRDSIRGYDLTARLGGDEFAIWLEGADRAIAEERARAFIAVVEGLIDSVPVGAEPLGASVGVAMLTAGADHADGRDATARVDALLAQADGAMYAAKQAGKSDVRFAGERGEGTS
ncbi:MAG: diguanylate cyclase [Alphaproteobacteria bacterium]|nr:diguanylate cyclase [Alphaproteobacteria bacterium]